MTCRADISIELLDGTLLDDAPDQRQQIVRLIEALPKISEIKEHLEAGKKLKTIAAPAGAIGVLRWVVGSCRAYLKETKAGEGVLNGKNGAVGDGAGHIRQFTFVVGSPEQETNFKKEIELAKSGHPNVVQYPTLLAFHGESIIRLW
jgi:ubiquitin-conjugating enzyme E2 Q